MTEAQNSNGHLLNQNQTAPMLLSTAKRHCDAYLRNTLAQQKQLSEKLREACQYSLFAGGKRIRPAFCFAVGEGFVSNSFERIVPIAAALECIHTYSLIHDDLPAMDNDTLRRGHATCHIQFDEATAILAGDALLNMAFEVLSASPWNINVDLKIKVIAYISQRSGASGMVGGQMLDLVHEHNPHLDENTLKSIHLGKTAALLDAALVAPAIALDLDDSIQNTLHDIAQNLGLAFQVADDILDVTQSTEVLGKNAQSDLAHEKSTYPSIVGLDASRKILQDLCHQALSGIETLPLNNTNLKELAQFIMDRKS